VLLGNKFQTLGTALKMSDGLYSSHCIVINVQALVWKPLPSLVFGVLSTVSGLLYVFLPETLGQVLPDTIEQAERFGRRHDKKEQ